MGDRNNPIKFGPEWLRNLARENNPGASGNSQNSGMSSNPATSPGATGGPPGGHTASGLNPSNTTNTPPKVQLAKLRYGREEMLALYDRNAEPPSDLKKMELLYQPRGKPPFALNNTFEDEMRDNMRGGPPMGGISQGERFGIGRGMGRGLSSSDGRGRPRVPFVRQPSTGRGASWHLGSPKTQGYSGGADDDSTLNVRSPWNASNGGHPSTPNRNSGEQAEWTPSKMFRNKRQGQATNWRQSREEGDEWRGAEGGRSRPNQQEKWERDWERPSQDKSQSWNSNRRTWGGDTQNNDDNLPEWAVDNAEACGGTFDSSGAFHGYSNDDTNLLKSQESSYPLTRSHTHGSFARSKTMEEGSEEWWASEKAKKLSPKRFDASDVKFKKQTSTPESSTEKGSDSKASGKDESQLKEIQENLESGAASAEPPENASSGGDDEKFNKKSSFKSQFTESKTFDALMRQEIRMEEAHDERGNFQSVMINPNNSLRQKHQNIVAAAEASRDGHVKPGILQLLQNAPTSTALENEMRKQQQASEDKIVEEIFDMTLDEKDLMQKPKPIASPLTNQSGANMASALSAMANSMPQLTNPALQLRLSIPVYQNQGLGMKQNMQGGMPSGMPGLPAGLQGLPSGMQGLPGALHLLPPSMQQVAGMQPLLQSSLQGSSMQSAGNQHGMQNNQMPTSMQGGMQQGGMQQGPMQGIQTSGMHGAMQQQSSVQQGGMQSSGHIQPSMQSVGITNSALNASLGLPIGGPGNNAIGIPLQGVPPPVMPNSGMNPGMGGPGMQGGMGAAMQGGGSGMPGFPSGGGMPGLSNANSSLFLGQNSNNPSIGSSNDIPLPNHGGQSNLFPMHGLQHSSSQNAFGSSIYSSLMQQTPPQPAQNQQNLADQWYYEDPEKNIQGPFTSKEMYNWYRAGFFSPSLMVRRACDTHMRPLGSYGPVVPFAQMDMLSSFPLSCGFDRSPGAHDTMLKSQQALGLESVMNMPNLNEGPTMDSLQFGSVGLIRNPPFAQQQPMVDSLWSQPSPSADLMWMQQAMGQRNDARVNNLPMFFWDQQPSAIASNALIPEEIEKKMKTEDQILAQLRGSQNISTAQNMPFLNEQTTVTTAPSKIEEAFTSTTSATPNMEELEKLIQKDTLAPKPSEPTPETVEVQPKPEKPAKEETMTEIKSPQNKAATDTKQGKQTKNETEKAAKHKENNTPKSKNKKKDDKKDELENKTKENDIVKQEKRSEEPSSAKNKKEDKINKKELEKEKKEWLKDGFTIVKSSEKGSTKDSKKKADEVKAAEEAERKRKEEERLAAEQDKKKKQADTAKKQQVKAVKRPAAESVVKKAPWSAVASQAMLAPIKDGLTLGEIQRLEREKKLEQMKEQQQMMQIIAQQQAAALAREQEMQANLGWAKKKMTNVIAAGQSMAEIQAETRKQSAAAAAIAAAAAAQALEEPAQPVVTHVPWGNAPNGVKNLGGFWDTQPQPSKTERAQESPKSADPKGKKKVTVSTPVKKEPSPAFEFESWCTTVLTSWSSKIDVPTFIGFLRDIESPYEVKDYVKCYLGETKDSSDFARQFLERRSKLLRVGMVTPSDDLCSPAMAVNPRTPSASDYQEVKGKGKKTKKNKMLKIDARILGFSVTAAEDRINVGDIDTV